MCMYIHSKCMHINTHIHEYMYAYVTYMCILLGDRCNIKWVRNQHWLGKIVVVFSLSFMLLNIEDLGELVVHLNNLISQWLWANNAILIITDNYIWLHNLPSNLYKYFFCNTFEPNPSETLVVSLGPETVSLRMKGHTRWLIKSELCQFSSNLSLSLNLYTILLHSSILCFYQRR